MTLRGVQKPGATTYTSSFTGVYETSAPLRAEIWAILASSGFTASAAAASAAIAADAAALPSAFAEAGQSPSGERLPLQLCGGAGHGVHGLGSPRFSREGPALVRGELPCACVDHVGAPAAAMTVSQIPS